MKQYEKPLLLIIDIQNAYSIGEEWECPDIDSTLDNIDAIIQSGITDTIITTRFIADYNARGVWAEYNQKYARINSDAFLNEYNSRLVGMLEAAPEDCSVASYDKSKYSALSVPEIKEACKHAPYVIITGGTTGCCVLSTIMDLIDQGIYMVVIKDATAATSDKCKDAVWEVLKNLSPLHVRLADTSSFITGQ